MEQKYVYNAELIRVIDGDTFVFKCDLGFDITYKIKVRLFGVNTPETYGVLKESEEYKRGMAAKQYAIDWFKSAGEIIVETIKTKKGSDKKGKYGRYLARIWGNNLCLNEDMQEYLDRNP